MLAPWTLLSGRSDSEIRKCTPHFSLKVSYQESIAHVFKKTDHVIMALHLILPNTLSSNAFEKKMLKRSHYSKLDESTARRQLKWPRSLSGRSIHLTLVTKWSWSWSWMTYCHFLCAMSISPPILRYSYFKIWQWKSLVKVMYVVKDEGHISPLKFKGQGYGQDQTHWSHLRPGVQSICLLFVSWQSDHFWLRYR